MKKVIIFLLVTLLMPINILNAYAQEPVKNVIQNQTLTNAKEKADVDSCIKNQADSAKEFIIDNEDTLNINEIKDIKNKDAMILGNPYKVIFPNLYDLKSIINNKPIDEVLNNSGYYWEVPILKKDGNTNIPASNFSIAFYNNAWKIAEVCGYLPADKSYLSSDVNQLSNLLKENNINDAKEFYHIRIQPLSSDIFYIRTDSNEYFIPLTFYDKNNLGVKDKTVYTKNEFMKILKPSVQTLIEDDEKGLAGGGAVGLPNIENNNSSSNNVNHSSSNNDKYTPLIIIIPTCLMIAGIGFAIYKKIK